MSHKLKEKIYFCVSSDDDITGLIFLGGTKTVWAPLLWRPPGGVAIYAVRACSRWDVVRQGKRKILFTPYVKQNI